MPTCTLRSRGQARESPRRTSPFASPTAANRRPRPREANRATATFFRKPPPVYVRNGGALAGMSEYFQCFDRQTEFPGVGRNGGRAVDLEGQSETGAPAQ